MKWRLGYADELLGLFVFGESSKPISPQSLFGFRNRRKRQPVKDAGGIAEEKDRATFAVGDFINQCPVLLEELDNLEPVVATTNLDGPFVEWHRNL